MGSHIYCIDVSIYILPLWVRFHKKQLKEHILANQQATEQLLKALLHQAFEVKET